MKLADAQLVANLARERDRLLGLRDRGLLSATVTMGDRADGLDPVMIKLMRPAFKAEIDRRVTVIDGDLRQLGVEIA